MELVLFSHLINMKTSRGESMHIILENEAMLLTCIVNVNPMENTE